jgi:hypothetical protein
LLASIRVALLLTSVRVVLAVAALIVIPQALVLGKFTSESRFRLRESHSITHTHDDTIIFRFLGKVSNHKGEMKEGRVRREEWRCGRSAGGVPLKEEGEPITSSN